MLGITCLLSLDISGGNLTHVQDGEARRHQSIIAPSLAGLIEASVFLHDCILKESMDQHTYMEVEKILRLESNELIIGALSV